MFETKTLKNNGGFYKLPLAWGSDDISALIAAQEKGVANTQKIIFQYRINSHTISFCGNAKIKIKATEYEKEWYENFLRKEPLNDLDNKYHQLCRKKINLHFYKKYIQTISSDVKQHSFFRILYWLRQKRKYNLTMKMMVYILIETFKKKQVIK